MPDFRHSISEEARGALVSMLGEIVNVRAEKASIFREGASVHGVWLLTSSSAYRVDHVWMETPATSMDYFEFTITKQDATKEQIQRLPIIFGKVNRTPVTSIHIIECFDEDEVVSGKNLGTRETVRFDGALAFWMGNGTGFKLGFDNSIAGSITLAHYDSAHFMSSVREWRVRETLSADTFH